MPGNPILTQRDLPRDRPTRSPRPATPTWSRRPRGDGGRDSSRRGPMQRPYNTGRETFLLPVTWPDGWPMIVDPGDADPDVVARPKLPPQAGGAGAGAFDRARRVRRAGARALWLMLRDAEGRWSRLERGALALGEPGMRRSAGEGQPAYLGRRQQHAWGQGPRRPSTSSRRDPGDEAGLAAFQSEAAWYALTVGLADGRRVVQLRRRGGSRTSPRQAWSWPRRRWPHTAGRCGSGSTPAAAATSSSMPKPPGHGGPWSATPTARCSARAPPAASWAPCSASMPSPLPPRRSVKSASTSLDSCPTRQSAPCCRTRRRRR